MSCCAVVQASVAERSWNAPSARLGAAEAVRPAPLSDGALLAGYETLAAQPGPESEAARRRAAMLREQKAGR